jgi:uncharacterized membrane protein YdbT with pleckstrin-like domain
MPSDLVGSELNGNRTKAFLSVTQVFEPPHSEQSKSAMSKYIQTLLGRNEKIVFETRLHPIIYFLPLAIVIGVIASVVAVPAVRHGQASVIVFLGLVWLAAAKIMRATTEIAVTTHRIVYKYGWISRNTIEINFKHIESLDITQSVLGRIFDFATVVIRGTGIGAQSIHRVAKPLELRNATFEQIEHSQALRRYDA